MFCPNCGKELPDGSKFCGFCGADIAKELKGSSALNGATGFEGVDTSNQSLGGYDPLGNDQTANNQYGGQTADNQYGGQAASNQYGGQTASNQYGGQQYGNMQSANSNAGQFDNSQFSGGQFDNNQYYNNQYSNQQYGAPNPNMPYGNYQGGIGQQNVPPKKSKKGIIAAIIAVILVLAIGGSAAAYHFITADKAKKKDKDDDKNVAASASTEEEEEDDDDSSSSATSASTQEEEEEVSGEEALEVACKNLAAAKDYTTKFTYDFEVSIEAPDEDISGTIVEKGDFDIVTDCDVQGNADANILEEAKGTVTRDILGIEMEEDITVCRGDFSGEFVSSIEYETGDKYEAIESATVDDVLGFVDYDIYDAELQDKTEDIDGTECYVYVSEDTYDQGGINGVFSPITGIYNGDTDLCTVTIYVSKKDAKLVRVDTTFTDSDGAPLASSLNTYTGAEDIEFVIDKLDFSLEFVDFDTDADIDPDFDDLEAAENNTNGSFTLYLYGILEVGSFDFTDNEDEDVEEDSDSEYVQDTYGALTYEVPKTWSGEEMTVQDYSGYVYVPDDDPNSLLLIMYEEADMSGATDSQISQAVDYILVSMCDAYGLSSDDIKKGTVNGGYAENTRGTISMNGVSLQIDIMVFETDGTGIGIVIYAAEDIENSANLANYYHLLESLEF